MYRFTLFQRSISNSRGQTKRVWYTKVLDAETSELIKRVSTGTMNRNRVETARRKVAGITAGMVDRWIIDRHQRRTLAPGTINKILQCLDR